MSHKRCCYLEKRVLPRKNNFIPFQLDIKQCSMKLVTKKFPISSHGPSDEVFYARWQREPGFDYLRESTVQNCY